MTSSFRSLVLLAALTGGCANLGGDSADTDTEVPVGTEDQTQICFPDSDGDRFGGTNSVSYIGRLPQGCAPAGGDCDDSRATVFPGALEVPGDGLDNDCAGGDITGAELDADPHLALFQSVQVYGFVDIGGGVGCVPGSWPSADDALNLYGDGFGPPDGWQRPIDNFRSGSVYGLDDRFACTDRLNGGTDNRWSVSSAMSGTDSRPLWDIDGEMDVVYRNGSPFVIEIEDGGRKKNFCTRYNIFDDRILPGNCAYTFVRDETPEDPYDTQDDVDPPAGTVYCYTDLDNDNHGAGAGTWVVGTTCGHQLALVAGDCNDNNASVHPGRIEVAGDGVDNDCDGYTDGAGGQQATWYRDADNDGYGGTTTMTAVGQPAGYVSLSGDCDDTDSDSNPALPEVPGDGEDNDCDGQVDELPGGGGGAVSMEIRANGYGSGSTLWGRYLVGQAGQQGNLPTWTSARGGVGAVTRLYIDTTVNGVRDAGAIEFVFASSGGYDMIHTGTYTVGQRVELCARGAISDYRWGVLRVGGASDNWVTEVGGVATVSSPVLAGPTGQDNCATWTID